MNIMLFGDRIADESRLFMLGLSRKMLNFRPVHLIGPQIFLRSTFIIIDNRISRIENNLCRSVVLFQFYRCTIRIILFEIQNILNIRPAPCIDTLIRIAYDAIFFQYEDNKYANKY